MEWVHCPYCIVKGTEEEGCCACDYTGKIHANALIPTLDEADVIASDPELATPD